MRPGAPAGAVLLLLVGAACEAQSAGDRIAGWQADVDTLLAQARRQHYVYRNRALPPDMVRAAEQLKAQVARFSDERMLLELQRLTVYLGDGHSYCAPFGARRVRTTWLPLHLYLFQDGLFVIDAAEQHARWIGSRVERLGGVPVDRLLVDLEQWVSRDNDVGIRWIGPFLLRFRGLLEALTEGVDGAGVSLDLVDRDGNRHSARIAFAPVPMLRGVPKLIPSRAPAAPPPPLYLRAVSTPFWLEDLREDDLVYVQVNQMQNDPAESLAAFARRLDTLLQDRRPRVLVLDLRHNNGGDESLTWPLLESLARFETSRDDARVIVITGPNTFSAAQVFIGRLDHRTGAIFAGVPSSSRPNFVGEENAVTPPWSGVLCSISNRYHESIPGDTRPWIEPEIPVALRSADYFANRDPVLRAIRGRE